MKVLIKITGLLRSPKKDKEFEIEIKDTDTVLEILKKIGYRDDEIKIIGVVVNGKNVSKSYKPEDGEKLFLYLPVGGGSK